MQKNLFNSLGAQRAENTRRIEKKKTRSKKADCLKWVLKDEQSWKESQLREGRFIFGSSEKKKKIIIMIQSFVDS